MGKRVLRLWATHFPHARAEGSPFVALDEF
jgi:hypothetical protein